MRFEQIRAFIFRRGCLRDGLMTVTHELLHMLGFVHEHMRPDGDDFITIHKENIVAGMEKKTLRGRIIVGQTSSARAMLII